MRSAILGFLLLWKPLAYGLAFLGIIFEGDIVLYSTSILMFQGLLNSTLLVLTVALAIIIGDLFWYWLGYKLHSSHCRLGRLLSKMAAPFDRHFQEHPFKTIFVSKFTYGLHHAILVRAGALKLPVRTFLKIDLISSFFWVLTIGLIAYFSQASYELIQGYIRFAEVSFFAGVLLFFIIWYLVSLVMRKEL